MVPIRPKAELEEFLDAWTRRHGKTRDQLLPLLHSVQDDFGYVDDRAVSLIAAALNLSRADVHGVITFYHDFRRALPGRHLVKLCRAESCQARGAAELEPLMTQRLGVAMGSTRSDGAVSLEPVYCLGLCSIGPNALFDGRPIARIDADMIERIAAEVEA